jgi:GH35 family endo-1,4-beta-xylanase
MEPRRGEVNYQIVDAMLEWTDKHDIPLRGHNIYWGVSNRVPDWQKNLDDDELRAVLKQRGLTIGRRYQGRFAEYDLNNEMMHDNYYEERLGPEITRLMAEWVKQGDPDAVLYLNDYDILTGNQLQQFVGHVETMLQRKVPFDGIGVQGHLHDESFDPAALRQALDALAQFDMPIRITEFNMPGQRSAFRRDRQREMTVEQEKAKAENMVDYYTICFAHPAVDGILMWGFWEGANWIPASSLYKLDWTPTPAARAYQKLVHDTWWTDEAVEADTSGKCVIPAFFGKYRVTCDGEEKIVELKKADGTVQVAF